MADPIVNTGSIQLPGSVSSEIWSKTQEDSTVMRMARSINLPGNGLTIPVLTGDPSAEWVNETEAKPVSKGTLATKQMQGYTMAVIEPFSNQFRRDYDALYNAMVDRLPRVLAQKFDSTVFGFEAAPGDNFDTLASAQAVNINVAGSKVYDAFVDLDASLAANGSELNGFAMSPQGRAIVMKAKDSNGRPLFTASANDSALDSILGVQAYRTKAAYKAGTPNTVGFAGDWTGARYGVVENMSVSISDQASLSYMDGETAKMLHLFQQNMFAVRVEFEVGFVVRDIADFRKLTDGDAA